MNITKRFNPIIIYKLKKRYMGNKYFGVSKRFIHSKESENNLKNFNSNNKFNSNNCISNDSCSECKKSYEEKYSKLNKEFNTEMAKIYTSKGIQYIILGTVCIPIGIFYNNLAYFSTIMLYHSSYTFFTNAQKFITNYKEADNNQTNK